jgi:hypothetical protein
MLVLQLDKWGLDDAHKDKQNKVYTSDFKVSYLEVGYNCDFELLT